VRLLLVEEDEGCSRALSRLFARAGFEVLASRNLEDALKHLENARIDVVISEMQFEDGDAIGLFERLKEKAPFCGRIVLTGTTNFLKVQETINRGQIHAFFVKPWDNDALVHGVFQVLERMKLALENKELQDELLRQNRLLEQKVSERTRLLEIAKKELELIFDAFEEPIALIDSSFTVRRANIAWAKVAGIDVREVKGKKCFEAFFKKKRRCQNCPLKKSLKSQSADFGVVSRTLVIARPLKDGDMAICSYTDVEGGE
jgi:response regulator RpfG family c-di-GMP phosphodiesterase